MINIKKIIISCIACLSLIIPLSLNVCAADEELHRVVDDADLLTDSEEKALESRIDDIISKYNFDVVIVTKQDIDGKTPMAYADDFYDYGGYGIGANHDGVLLLLSMAERDWWISTTGYGITVFTDYGIKEAGNKFVSYLSNGNYNGGFEKFISLTEEYIEEAKNDKPFDYGHKYMSPDEKSRYRKIAVGIGLLIGLIIALIVTLIFKSQLKSVAFKYNANEYEVPGSLNVRRSNDIFLYKTVTKSEIPRESSSGGGGGSSTHTSSSGTTHGGGGGKF